MSKYVQGVLQEVYALDLAGPVARQYFMEVSGKVWSTQLHVWNLLHCTVLHATRRLFETLQNTSLMCFFSNLCGWLIFILQRALTDSTVTLSPCSM